MITQLKIIRLSKEIKLIKLANLSGISVSFLSRIENGRLKGSKKTRAKIAKVLGVSEEILFGK